MPTAPDPFSRYDDYRELDELAEEILREPAPSLTEGQRREVEALFERLSMPERIEGLVRAVARQQDYEQFEEVVVTPATVEPTVAIRGRAWHEYKARPTRMLLRGNSFPFMGMRFVNSVSFRPVLRV